MSASRRACCAAVAVLVMACGACSPGMANSPAATQSTPAPDYTAPGAARQALDDLQRASGQPDAIKAEVTRQAVSLVVVDGTTAKTWSLRDGKPAEVDGDTQYVGQAHFKLSDYSLDNVSGLFQQAADVSRSKNPQELQIVDYSGGRVYMTVTTSPESQTIFFNADGTMVPALDLTTQDGIAMGLKDAVGNTPSAYAIAVNPTLGVTVDAPGGQEASMIRSVRAPKYPTRVELRTDKPQSQLQFDPHTIDAAVLARLAQKYGTDKKPAAFIADRRDGLLDPTIRMTADGRTLVFNLAGEDITATVKK